MCSPHASHLLQKEFELLNLAPPLYADANFDWPASEKVWEDIWQMVPTLKKLSFGEGEPFINKPGLAFLRKLQESGHASHIDLIIDTNMTMLLPKHYEFLQGFRRCIVSCSLDGYRKLNEFIRFPSKWSVIDKNLRSYNEFVQADTTGRRLNFLTTVSVLNVNQLGDLVDYCVKNFASFPRLEYITIPSFMSLQVLPKSFKDFVEERLIVLKQVYPDLPNRDAFLESLSSLSRFMLGADRTEELPELAKKMRQMDEYRGHALVDANPELASLLNTIGPYDLSKQGIDVSTVSETDLFV